MTLDTIIFIQAGEELPRVQEELPTVPWYILVIIGLANGSGNFLQDPIPIILSLDH